MKKLNMLQTESVTFEDGCNKYLDNCRQRNLREGTINHYKQSYTQYNYSQHLIPYVSHSLQGVKFIILKKAQNLLNFGKK